MTSLQTQFMQMQMQMPRSSSPGPDVVYITRTEYNALLRVSRQYENLCRSLRQGGVEENAITLLSTDDDLGDSPPATPATQTQASTQVNSPIQSAPQRQPPPALTWSNRPSARRDQHGSSGSEQHHNSGDWGDTDFNPSSEDASFQNASATGGPRIPQRAARRSIYLSGLPNGTTHADITAAMSGGQLLDIFILGRDRAAVVAFLHGEDAQNFRSHYSKHDFYINNKRVTADWADRQYTVPGYIAHKVASGHNISRNLVIQNCNPELTEEAIREDLEHIHNLIVINVTFHRGDCFISTNSIRNAMFARTCMTSRQKYKGFSIRFGEDECNVALPRVSELAHHAERQVKKKPLNPMANRFELLSFGDDD